jgi:dipeptidase E
MRLYLSSYKLGNHSNRLLELLKGKKKTVYIPNALDFATDLERKKESISQDIQMLEEIGLEVEILDLKNYFAKTEELKTKLSCFDLVFARGGNVFILRKAYAQSGLDQLLIKSLDNDEFVYAGYSAGVCVLSPTLRGAELVDDLNAKANGYKDEVIWEGLSILDYCFAPHYKTPQHPETKLVDKYVEYLEQNNMEYRALRDGEVIIIKN